MTMQDLLTTLTGPQAGWILALVLVLALGLTLGWAVYSRRSGGARLAAEAEHARTAETQLAALRERQSLTERLARTGTWIWDIPEDRVTWSDGCYEIFGFPPEEFGADFETVHALV